VSGDFSTGQDQVRTAELIGALCLATDLGMRLPFEHGLRSTLFAMRLARRLGVDAETAHQTYYGCLLFYVGCTADAEIHSDLFGEGALLAHFTPVMFGTPFQTVGGVMRALAEPGSPRPVQLAQVARKLPRAVRGHRRHLTALCEVAQMLSARVSMPPAVRDLFVHLPERWDGKGHPGQLAGQEIPLALRIIHVARDAAFQRLLGGVELAARVVRERAGGAFDPVIAALLADHAAEIMTLDEERSAWDETLANEPSPWSTLEGQAIDEALAAMGDFADLASPYLVGHSAGVAQLAAAAARQFGLPTADQVAVTRAALVHDVGRVAVPFQVWQKAAPLTPDEWERVRLHAYHTGRVLSRSPYLTRLAPVSTGHHERLDGSGYHHGATAVALAPAARLLAAADAYHAMTEPRAHRAALTPSRAAELLGTEARDGRLDGDCVAAVLAAAGHRPPRLSRPAGLTEREAQVVGLLARGLQTKQIGRTLGITTKTADHHVQNAYAKIGVSTRAAATLFAMQHGLVAWGELPMVGASDRP
jgi:HD-GYP domain-containing protein (c-di-GMP phosphodiesterase class II)